MYIVELVAAPHQSQTNGLLALSPCCYTSRFVPSTRHPSTRRGHAVFSLHDDPLIAEPPCIGAFEWCWNVDDGIPFRQMMEFTLVKNQLFSVSSSVLSSFFDLKNEMQLWKNPGWIGIFWSWVLCRYLFLPHLSGPFVGPFAKDFIHIVDDAFSNM